jgi:hypothetical protein
MFWDTASGTMKPTGEYVKSFVDGVCEVCCAWVAINRSQARGVLLTWGDDEATGTPIRNLVRFVAFAHSMGASQDIYLHRSSLGKF